MKKTLSIVLLLLLVNCNTTKSTTQEESKPSIDNIKKRLKDYRRKMTHIKRNKVCY